MSPELAAGLRRDFPSLYAWPTGPENAIEFECGDGWEALIRGMSASLVLACPTMRCEQIKAKYGSLRVYVFPHTDPTRAIIADAERLSVLTCEQCGADGTCERTLGWWLTLCGSCRKEKERER